MPEQAKVTSIEALEAFRTTLVLYVDKAGRVLDEINDDVMRMRLWLDPDRYLFWEKELRRRTKILEQARAELMTARLSDLNVVNPLQQSIVREARLGVAEAQTRLSLVKQWSRQYDNRVMPLAKEVDKLRDVLDHDLRRAIAFLAQAVKTLDAYAEKFSPQTAPAANPSAPGDAAPTAATHPRPDAKP